MNGTCEVAEKWSDDDSLRIRFRVPVPARCLCKPLHGPVNACGATGCGLKVGYHANWQSTQVADVTLLSGILLKGYIGLDGESATDLACGSRLLMRWAAAGTSLTVTAVDYAAGTFCVMLVPHTQGACRLSVSVPAAPAGMDDRTCSIPHTYA